MSWPVAAYIEERKPELAVRTWTTYAAVLRKAELALGPLQDLTGAAIAQWADANGWRDQDLSALRGFLRWTRHPLAEHIPRGIPPESKRELVWYHVAELEAAVQACRTPRERLLLHLAAELMLRRVEIERLREEDLEATSIRVLGKGRHGGKVRRIPYHPYTRTILASFAEGDTRSRARRTAGSNLSVGNDGRPGRRTCSSVRSARSGSSNSSQVTSQTPPTRLTSLLGLAKSALDKELKRIAARVPLHLEFHALRRTGARLYCEAGTRAGKGPLEVLNELRGILGHEDLRTTMRYVGWDLETAGATMAYMPSLETPGVPASAPAGEPSSSAPGDLMDRVGYRSTIPPMKRPKRPRTPPTS